MDGIVLDAADPAPRDLRLPSGDRLEAIGCRSLPAAEARVLADRLDRVAPYDSAAWRLYSGDLSRVRLVSITALPEGVPVDHACDEIPEPTPVPPPSLPRADLSGIDACSLVRGSVAGEHLGAMRTMEAHPPGVFDIVSPGCHLLDERHTRATIYLYGRTVDRATARSLVEGHLGTVSEGSHGGVPIWISGCWQQGRQCPAAVAGWSDGRLVFVVPTQNVIQQRPSLALEDVRAFIAGLLASR